jgi:hypothetical protein
LEMEKDPILEAPSHFLGTHKEEVVHNASLKRERLGRQDYSGWELLL